MARERVYYKVVYADALYVSLKRGNSYSKEAVCMELKMTGIIIVGSKSNGRR